MAPLTGQNTEEILLELGYTKSEYQEIKGCRIGEDKQLIFPSPPDKEFILIVVNNNQAGGGYRMTEQALSDLKVVEWGTFILAPFCTKLMADMGQK